MRQRGAPGKRGNATNAATVGGLAPSGFIGTARANDKVTTSSGTAAPGTTVPLFTQGPFTVTLVCSKDMMTGVTADIKVASSEANSIMAAGVAATAGTAQTVVLAGPSTGFGWSAGNLVDAEAPSGATLWFAASAFVNSPTATTATNDCMVNILRLI